MKKKPERKECQFYQELFGNYVDEELTSVLRERLEKHVAKCDACAADLSTLKLAVQSLHQERSPTAFPSEWFVERTLDMLARDSDTVLDARSIGDDVAQLRLWADEDTSKSTKSQRKGGLK